MINPITILSTRKLDARALEKLPANLRMIQADFIEKRMTPAVNEIAGTYDAVVLTSITAVRAWIQIKTAWKQELLEPIFCTAFATRQMAESYGLKIAGVAANASQLADVIISHDRYKNVLFVGSNRRRKELPEKLREAGVLVRELEAYQTELTPHPIHETLAAVIFYSPSTVDSFLIHHAAIPPAFCLGRTTANHAQKRGFSHIILSHEPTIASLIEKVRQHYSPSEA